MTVLQIAETLSRDGSQDSGTGSGSTLRLRRRGRGAGRLGDRQRGAARRDRRHRAARTRPRQVRPVRVCAGPSNPDCGLLHYHGGPVMHTTTTYAIYWLPTGYTSWDGQPAYGTNYQSVIDQYFTDLPRRAVSCPTSTGPRRSSATARERRDNCTGSRAPPSRRTRCTAGSYVDTRRRSRRTGAPIRSGMRRTVSSTAQLDHRDQPRDDPATGLDEASATHMFFIYTPRGVRELLQRRTVRVQLLLRLPLATSGPAAHALIYAN